MAVTGGLNHMLTLPGIERSSSLIMKLSISRCSTLQTRVGLLHLHCMTLLTTTVEECAAMSLWLSAEIIVISAMCVRLWKKSPTFDFGSSTLTSASLHYRTHFRTGGL
jgi:hypothetical protein